MTVFQNADSAHIVSSSSRSGQSQALKYINCIFEAIFFVIGDIVLGHCWWQNDHSLHGSAELYSSSSWAKKGRGLGHVTYFWILGPPIISG